MYPQRMFVFLYGEIKTMLALSVWKECFSNVMKLAGPSNLAVLPYIYKPIIEPVNEN